LRAIVVSLPKETNADRLDVATEVRGLPDAYLFRMNPAGTRDNKIVLMQLRDFHDPEHGGAYTVKRYLRVGRTGDSIELGGTIRLRPQSTDPRFAPIDVHEDENQIRVIAEMLRVL
jgi:hypothetical protein